MNNLLFLDTETTGKDENARLVQLAFKLGNTKSNWLFKPPVEITFEAMSVHHITNEMVDRKPKFNNIFKKLVQDYLNENIMVAHNAPFDAEILRREGLKVGKMIDTLKVVQRLFDLSMYKLQFLRYHFGLEIQEVRAHDAEGDIEVLEALFNYLVHYMARTMPELGMHLTLIFDQMLEWTEEPLLLRRIGFGKHKGMLFSEVPKDYLQWLKKQPDNEEDLIYTLNHYLQCDSIPAPNTATLGF